jgi:hypothetical protein
MVTWNFSNCGAQPSWNSADNNKEVLPIDNKTFPDDVGTIVVLVTCRYPTDPLNHSFAKGDLFISGCPACLALCALFDCRSRHFRDPEETNKSFSVMER